MLQIRGSCLIFGDVKHPFEITWHIASATHSDTNISPLEESMVQVRTVNFKGCVFSFYLVLEGPSIADLRPESLLC